MSADKSRRPRLPPRKVKTLKENPDPAIAAMDRARRTQKKEQKKLRRWLKDNVEFNTDSYIDQWVKLRDKYKKELLEIVVQHMSIGDAVGAVNETLRYGFKMEEAGIDQAEVEMLVAKVFRVHVMQALLKSSPLDKVYRDDLLRRAIAREFPIRDGAPSRAERPVQIPVPRAPVAVREREPQEPTAYQQRVREMRHRAGDSKIVKVREDNRG